MISLRQSTASQEVPLGYFLDSTDGNTEETGLTIANTDIKIWKSGATTLANKNSGGATHISNGIYYAALVVPAPRPPAWGVPWQVNWKIGQAKPESVYLPVVSK